MIRLFLEPEEVAGNSIKFSEDYHHLKKVLRVKPGQKIEIVCNDGRLFLVEISDFSVRDKLVSGTILESSLMESQNSGVSVAVALTKKGLDTVVSNLSQLNIDKLIPFICRRSVIKVTPAKSRKLVSRLSDISRESAKQCRGRKVMAVCDVASYSDVLKMNGEKYVFTLNRKANLPRFPRNSEMILLIGPEGDFSPEELDQALGCGASLVRMGGNVLRTENAATVISTIVQYQRGWFL